MCQLLHQFAFGLLCGERLNTFNRDQSNGCQFQNSQTTYILQSTTQLEFIHFMIMRMLTRHFKRLCLTAIVMLVSLMPFIIVILIQLIVQAHEYCKADSQDAWYSHGKCRRCKDEDIDCQLIRCSPSAEIESIANMLEHSGVQPYVEVRHLYIAQTLTYAKSSPKQVHQIGTYKTHYVPFPSRSIEHTV